MGLYGASDRKRAFNIPDDEPSRSCWCRDYGRLIHSASFRRLQGKTQLFPGHESDFFRNRLTHSLEVAQIARGIAENINHDHPFFKDDPINVDIVQAAALAHDLGHPPFGHNGEKALNECMRTFGGFEGNAQTLRILARLEKRELPGGVAPAIVGGHDRRVGLNLTYRTLAAVLKYDEMIPGNRRRGSKLEKGYYATEAGLVKEIKAHVAGSVFAGKLKTIECRIMDLADDIVYSTFDLEDAFKAGFLSPLDMLSSDAALLEVVAGDVREDLRLRGSTKKDVENVLMNVFGTIFQGLPPQVEGAVAQAYKASNMMASNAHFRTELTSSLIKALLGGVYVDRVDKRIPALSSVRARDDVHQMIAVLKHYTFRAVTMASRLSTVEYRGYGIVKSIFEALVGDDGDCLLPDDYRRIYGSFKSEVLRRRVICDFVAGMTDRYAVEFYGRLYSENPETIFKGT